MQRARHRLVLCLVRVRGTCLRRLLALTRVLRARDGLVFGLMRMGRTRGGGLLALRRVLRACLRGLISLFCLVAQDQRTHVAQRRVLAVSVQHAIVSRAH